MRLGILLLVGAATIIAVGGSGANGSTGLSAVGGRAVLPLGARAAGPLAMTTPVHLTIVLKSRDPSALATAAAAVSSPSSPEFRHYVTAAQFARRFGADASAVETVRSALEARGLSVDAVSANDLAVTATGTAATVERALSVSLSRVSLPDGESGYANASAPLLPSSVAEDVEGVLGLSDAADERSDALSGQAVTGGPQPCTALRHDFSADQIASGYRFSGLYGAGDFGAGQTVAVLEFAAYRPSDVSAYASCYGITPNITGSEVDGGPPADPAVDLVREADIDLEQVIGLAPKANLLAYAGPNSGAGPYDLISQAVVDDKATVISASYGLCEQLAGPTLVAAENTVLQEAAVQGQTFVAASGDSGSENCSAAAPSNTSLSVSDPAAQPYATAVGGTTLEDNNPPPLETVWNNGRQATGGGISDIWSMPSYQSGAPGSLGVIGPDSSGTPCGSATYCREVPDVSADGDPGTPYVFFAMGTRFETAGTSASTPLWAALIALANDLPGCHGTPIGFANPALYEIAALSYAGNLNDVTPGRNGGRSNNDVLNAHGGLYPLTRGYDMTTGLGTPVGQAVAHSLCSPGSPASTIAISKPATVTTDIGHRASLTVHATDSRGLTPTFSAAGLPSGLTINSSSGMISGVPNVAGTNTVRITGSDASDGITDTPFQWNIRAGAPGVSRGAFRGAGRGKPSLRFTLTAGRGAPPLSFVEVSRPSGMRFATAKRLLARGIVAKAGSARDRLLISFDQGKLELILSRDAVRARFTLGAPAIELTSHLAKQIRHHRAGKLKLHLLIGDAVNDHTSSVLNLKL